MGSIHTFIVNIGAVGLLASGASADVISFAAQRPAYPAVDSIEALRDSLNTSAHGNVSAPFETMQYVIVPMGAFAEQRENEAETMIEQVSPLVAPAFDLWLGIPNGLSVLMF